MSIIHNTVISKKKGQPVAGTLKLEIVPLTMLNLAKYSVIFLKIICKITYLKFFSV